MQARNRTFLKIGAGVLIVLTIGYFALSNYIENKITSAIENAIPDNVDLNFQKSNFNVFAGNYSLKNVEVKIHSISDSLPPTTVAISEFRMKNLSYSKYLGDKSIFLKKIIIEKPEISIQNKLEFAKDSSLSKSAFKIEEIEIQEGNLILLDSNNLQKMVSKNVTMSLFEVQRPSKEQGLPFSSFQFKSDSTSIRVSEFDILTLGKVSFENSHGSAKDISLKTNMSKEDLSENISEERDHYSMVIPEVNYTNFQFIQDSVLGYSLKELKIKSPSIEIYRDKTQPDTYTYKPLLSKMLRNLPFPLNIDSTKIENGHITYEELIIPNYPPGSVDFNGLHATVINLGNVKQDNETTIAIDTKILKDTPLTADWRFKVGDEVDQFSFKAEVDDFDASELNDFTIPSDKLKLEGNFIKTFFNITGNDNASHVDIMVRFNNLKISLLKDDLSEKKSILSAIANLFISNKSTDEDGNYHNASANVVRNKYKSNFNYIWINILESLKESVR